MKKLLLVTASALLISNTSVNAADFSGAFLGLSTGYSFGDLELNYEDGTTGNGDFSESTDIKGFEGGIFAGYRHQFLSGLNLGVEAGYSLGNADGSYSLNVGANNFTADFEKNSEWYVSLKPGFLVNERTLAYGILGYQRAEFEATTFLNGTQIGNSDDYFDGYHIGLGLEHMFTNNISLRGEYLYNNYSDNDYAYPNGQVETWDGDESVLKVGVTYNFGSMGTN